MWSRKSLASMLLAAGMLGLAATPLPSLAEVDIQLNFGPPPPRYEVVPPPRAGYVWAPGYWEWEGRRHVWRSGHWEATRPGYVYHSPRWVEHDGRWVYHASRWDRNGDGIPDRRQGYADNDRDGIPNYRDPTPNGEHRLRDRDHDGVPDRYDSRPDNPNRH